MNDSPELPEVKDLHCSQCGRYPRGISSVHYGNKCPCGGYWHDHLPNSVGCSPNCPRNTRFPSPAQAEKLPKCATCGHIEAEHGRSYGPCYADWGKCPCKAFVLTPDPLEPSPEDQVASMRYTIQQLLAANEQMSARIDSFKNLAHRAELYIAEHVYTGYDHCQSILTALKEARTNG